MLLPTLKLQLQQLHTHHSPHAQWKKPPPKEDGFLYKGQHKGVSWPAGVWWENKRLAKWKVSVVGLLGRLCVRDTSGKAHPCAPSFGLSCVQNPGFDKR